MDVRRRVVEARKDDLAPLRLALDLRKVESDVWSLELDARKVELDLWRVEALALPAGLGSAPRAGDLHGVLEAEAAGAPVGFDIVGDSGA